MNEFIGRLRGLARNKPVFNGAVAATIALVVAALSMLAVDHISFLTSADRFVQDYEIATRSPFEPQDPNILIVGVDEAAMQHFPYRSPLDRARRESVERHHTDECPTTRRPACRHRNT